MRRHDAANALPMLSRDQIEGLDRAVRLGGQEQLVPLEVDGEVAEITRADRRERRRRLERQRRWSGGAGAGGGRYGDRSGEDNGREHTPRGWRRFLKGAGETYASECA
ncbi:MAG TPA: hypothetical protein VE591_04375, partial [Candidatus Acidoferrum sp.]|nr:hypothetical protein [Candidatus Acidoferrum sp.]